MIENLGSFLHNNHRPICTCTCFFGGIKRSHVLTLSIDGNFGPESVAPLNDAPIPTSICRFQPALFTFAHRMDTGVCGLTGGYSGGFSVRRCFGYRVLGETAIVID